MIHFPQGLCFSNFFPQGSLTPQLTVPPKISSSTNLLRRQLAPSSQGLWNHQCSLLLLYSLIGPHSKRFCCLQHLLYLATGFLRTGNIVIFTYIPARMPLIHYHSMHFPESSSKKSPQKQHKNYSAFIEKLHQKKIKKRIEGNQNEWINSKKHLNSEVKNDVPLVLGQRMYSQKQG